MSRSDSDTAEGRRPPAGVRRDSRRGFLKTVGALSGGAIAAAGAADVPAAEQEDKKRPKVPQVRLGRYSISRLICGSNCFTGGSHLSVFVNHQMRDYYTPEQILKTLTRCQQEGINCWQAGAGHLDLYRRLCDEGGKMHFVALGAGGREGIDKLARGGCIAVAHHGEVTDRLFKNGELDKIHDYLKQVRDAGLLVGVSTHMPDVVDAVESKGWDIDYYMTCVYERHRSAEDLQTLLGHVPIPVGEVYLTSDPPRMYQAIRKTKRTCLAFKILAAGRLSDRRAWVEQAFRQTYESIKPGDAAIVGIYDRYTDQVADDAALVRRFGASGGAG